MENLSNKTQDTSTACNVFCLQNLSQLLLRKAKILLLFVVVFGVAISASVTAFAVGPALDVISSEGLVMIGKNDPNDTSDTQHKLLLGGGGLWSVSGSKNGNFIIGKTVANPSFGTLIPLHATTTNGRAMINVTPNSVMIDSWGTPAGMQTVGFRHKLSVNGSISATSVSTWSDKRYKREIEPISNLDNLFKINAVQYKHSGEAFAEQLEMLKKSGSLSASDLAIAEASTKAAIEARNKDNTIHYGFIAQELREVYPGLVTEDGYGFLSVNYTELIPVLVDAIKELNSKIEVLESRDKELLRNTTNDITTSAVLYQNNPNPFDTQTEIKYYIPAVAVNATICVYDMVGAEVLKMEIRGRESGSITIDAGQLKAGMYMYALLVDGKEVDVKRMILTGK